MTGIMRLLLDEALSEHLGAQDRMDGVVAVERTMTLFGRPRSEGELARSLREMPVADLERAFDAIIAYKRSMSGGNMNVAAAYVQLAAAAFHALPEASATPERKAALGCSSRLFTSPEDNSLIADGIDFDVRLGMI